MLILRLLGPFEIRTDEHVVRYNGRDKGLTLLAYLAASAGKMHTRADLADLFWPDLAPERARQNLRQTLLRLRRLLADGDAARPCLPNHKYSVHFDPDAGYWLDLTAFATPLTGDESIAQLQQRATLCRGDFLADCVGGISERFDVWLAQRRAECRNLALIVESRLAAAHEQAGQIDRAIEHARRCTRLEPWDESAQRRLLRLLAHAGHAAAAVQHFDAWREDLRRELDADAQAETVALVERIRNGVLVPARLTRSYAPTERRQITVLDCGLRCREDDPEAIALALAEPRCLAQTLLVAHGAWVALPQPDRITAYFGWPAADERAAIHAARAAFALLERLAAEHPGTDIRIGIDQAPMLVGDDESGGWLAAERALHLRVRAPPGTVQVGAALAASLAERFDLEQDASSAGDSGGWRLLGERRPVPLERVEPLALTGRATELARLTRAWRRACVDGPRVVALTGPAGIGKSRLAREFMRSKELRRTRVHWCECDPLHVDSPLFALRRMLQGVLALTPADDTQTLRARLHASLPDDRSGALAQALVPLFCSSGPDVDAADAGISGAGLRRPLICAMAQLLAQVLAASGPGAVLLCEDAHWADASTLEVLDALARCRGGKFLVLMLARELPWPHDPAPWFESVRLAPLDPGASAALARLAASTHDPGEARVAAAAAAEGIPLFIIELARMRAAGDGAPDGLPSNLRDLLTARLAQAGADRMLLQAAAVIGRTFEAGALRGLASESCAPLDAALERLVALDLLERTAGGARFTHALLQRCAYDSLPRTRRIELHRRRAEQIRAEIGAGSAPEELAWHLSAAGLDAEAAQWWLRAAQRASRLSAYEEAVQFAGRSLTAIEAAPERDAGAQTELAALLLGAYARVALGGYFDPDARRLHERARALLEKKQVDPLQAFGILRGYWFGASSRASHREARSIAEEMARIADGLQSPSLRGIARYLIGNSTLWLGGFTEAFAHLEQAVTLLRRASTGTSAAAAHDQAAALAHDQDFEATAIGYLGWAHWYLGRTEAALEHGRRAMELARTRGHVLTSMHTATTFCSIAMGSGREEESADVAAGIVHAAQAHHLAMWADIGQLLQCWAGSARGIGAGCAPALQVLDRLCQAYPGGAAGFQVIAAQICLAQGDCRQARHVLLALRSSLRRTRAGMFAAVRLMLESRLASQQGRPVRAAAAARRALAVARAQGAAQLEAMARERMRQAWPDNA